MNTGPGVRSRGAETVSVMIDTRQRAMSRSDVLVAGGRFTNISIKLCEEWQPYLRYVKSYGRSALA